MPDQLHHRVRRARLDDEPTVVVDLEIPDDAPTQAREGIARRALVNGGQPCPCGARLQMPSRQERRAAAREGRVVHVVVEHEPDCPATTDNLLTALDERGGADE